MDEGTYWARVKRIASMMDMRTAFVTDSQLERAVDLVKRHDAGAVTASEAEIRAARKIKDAAIHPDTGEKIFLPLRLSFIVPCNLIVDTLMISARGSLQNVGAQWLNQTYNSLHYYANRNASNAEGGAEIFQAYLGATAASVAAAVGLNSLLDKLPPGSRWAPIARRLVPFCAVAAADVLNMGITRKNEYLEGIRVQDSRGQEVGKSRVAGALAVGACIGGRIAAAAPILVIPPLVMHRLESTELFSKRPWLRTSALMAMIGISIQVCVPLFFGMFKQRADIDVKLLEEDFRGLTDEEGQPIRTVTYNKGI